MKKFIGLILVFVEILGVGYLVCSLCSWSFKINEWNTVSHVIKWIFIALVICNVIYIIIRLAKRDEIAEKNHRIRKLARAHATMTADEFDAYLQTEEGKKASDDLLQEYISHIKQSQ